MSLVLARRSGESLILYTSDGTIVIEFEQNRFGRMTALIQAPQSVKILRAELLGTKEEAAVRAAAS